MFRFLELELHGWAFWRAVRIPVDADIVVLSGLNGSGKTTMLDAIRQLLHAPHLSQNRRLSHYLRRPNNPALIRAVVSNRADQKGRRPFERQQVVTDEATLACAIVPNGGTPEKRYAVLSGRRTASELQRLLIDDREYLGPEEYGRVLEYAGVSRSLMNILALEQGRADELSRKKPKELFRWLMEARGSQQVLQRYTSARARYEESCKEVARQQAQILGAEAQLAQLDRNIRRLDEYLERQSRVGAARDILAAAKLQVESVELEEIKKRSSELDSKVATLVTTSERLKHELPDDELALKNARARLDEKQEVAQRAIKSCDEGLSRKGASESRLKQCRAHNKELSSIPEEDLESLNAALLNARRDAFKAEQAVENSAASAEDLERRILDLSAGVKQFQREVAATLAELIESHIEFSIAAEKCEVEDEWLSAVESSLGPLRFALCVSDQEIPRATTIAKKHNFPGPIALISDTTSDATCAGPLQLASGAPKWLREWATSVTFAEREELVSDLVITTSGVRRDEYGIWVSQAPDRVLGTAANREQLRICQEQHAQSLEELESFEQMKATAADRLSQLESSAQTQERRRVLLRERHHLRKLTQIVEKFEAKVSIAIQIRKTANQDLAEAEKSVQLCKEVLEKKSKEHQERQKDLDESRSQLGALEGRKPAVEASVEQLKSSLSVELRAKAFARELPTAQLAERDLQAAEDSLRDFVSEGPIPDETVRAERQLVQRNVEELQFHVREREAEAETARVELNNCRGDYLEVIRSTMHDYSRRARALAEMASAKLEVELPDLTNDDRSIDEAEIIVRIGFDGKRPTDIRDDSHSGGQQVVAGLILLMSMAETEGNSFFIVDEPFAHLSLDRVDEVGQFLRRSGAQFLITVPTTLDRGQLDPASLVITLRKKRPDEPFAALPIVARA